MKINGRLKHAPPKDLDHKGFVIAFLYHAKIFKAYSRVGKKSNETIHIEKMINAQPAQKIKLHPTPIINPHAVAPRLLEVHRHFFNRVL